MEASEGGGRGEVRCYCGGKHLLAVRALVRCVAPRKKRSRDSKDHSLWELQEQLVCQ